MAADTASETARRHRPKATTVFVAAFVAGAVAAVVVNRVLDVHLAQAKPQVESEPIFVTLRPLPQGAPVTVWDVALRDWPRAMLPASALRASDSFTGSVLKYPLREGQPLLSVHLVPLEPAASSETRPALEEVYAPPPQARPVAERTRPQREPDMWTPGGTPASMPQATTTPAQAPPAESNATIPPAEPEPTEVAVAEPTAPAVPEPTEQAVAEPAGETPADETQVVAEPTLAADEGQEDAESTAVPPVVAAEPAPAVGMPTEAAEPATLPPAAPRQPRLTTDVEPALDMPSRPAVDLDTLPSVMARAEESTEAAEEPRTAGSVRYLVVPERIARQADTMFAVPEAPAAEEGAVPASPQAPPKAQADQPAPRSVAEPRQQRSGSSASGRQTSQPSVQRQASQQPSSRQPSSRQPEQAAGQGRSPLGPRAWGEMFPNVAAGVEAIGNRWRGEEPEASEPPRPAQPR